MDINASYLNSISENSRSSAAAAGLKDTFAGAGKASADDELMDACKQFEAYFVEQMFKEMRKTVPVNALDSGSNAQLVDYFKDNLTQEYAKEATERNSLGLAQMLYEQMKRNYSAVSPEEAAASASEETPSESTEESGSV